MDKNGIVNQIKIGLVFFTAMIVLGLATLTITDVSLFDKKIYYVVYFPSVAGLKTGDPVRVLGYDAGKVDSIELADYEVKVVLRVRVPIDFHTDYVIRLEEFSIIGGVYIAVLPGTPDAPKIAADEKLKGVVVPTFGAVGELAGENREGAKQVVDNLKEITDVIRKGEGTLGKLLTESDIYDDLKESAETVKQLLADVKKGEGTIGKALVEEDLYNELKEIAGETKGILGEVRGIVDDVKSGKGTLGKFLYDEQFYNNLISISDKIDKGDGTIAKLLNEDELYNKAVDALESADKVLGPAARLKVDVGLRTARFVEAKEQLSKIYIKIYPNENRYFLVGGAFRSLSNNSLYDFKNKINDNDGDLIIEPELQLAWFWPVPSVTMRAGLIEGKLGGGIDVDFALFSEEKIWRWTVEGRDAYNDMKNDGLHEKVSGPMIRTELGVIVWNNFRLFAGANRLLNDGEFYGGVSFEYTDEDIKSLVSLIASGF